MSGPARILIDSHVLVWLLYEPEKISDETCDMLESATAVLVSAASFWELSLKHQAGKLLYGPGELQKGAEAAGLSVLPVTAAHVLGVSKIKVPGADPFDALLLAQSKAERCVFLTADRNILDNFNGARDART